MACDVSPVRIFCILSIPFLAQIACKEAYCVEYIGSAAPIPNNYTWSCRWYTHLCEEQLQIWQSFEVLMEQLSYLFLLTQKLWFWSKHCKVGHVRKEFMQKSKNPRLVGAGRAGINGTFPAFGRWKQIQWSPGKEPGWTVKRLEADIHKIESQSTQYIHWLKYGGVICQTVISQLGSPFYHLWLNFETKIFRIFSPRL